MDELPTFPDNISNDNRTFLTKCFQRDPNDRGDVSSLLLHPFLINNLSQSQRTASRNKMQSKSRYSHLPSRGGGHHDNNHISEISVRPTTSAGERLWTAGAGAQRWEKEKQREKDKKELKAAKKKESDTKAAKEAAEKKKKNDGYKSPTVTPTPAPYEFSSPPSNNKSPSSSIEVLGVDLMSNNLRPLKSPVRLIGSPQLLSASVPKYGEPDHHMMSIETLEANEPVNNANLGKKKLGFGRDGEKRRKKQLEKEKQEQRTSGGGPFAVVTAFGVGE